MSRKHELRLAAGLLALAAALPIAPTPARADLSPPPFSVAMIPGGAITNAMLQHPSLTLGSTVLTLGGTTTALNGLASLGIGTSAATAPAEIHASNPFTAGTLQPTLLVGRRPDGQRASLGLGYDQTHSWNFDSLGDGSVELWSYNGTFSRQFYMPQGGPGTFVNGVNGADYLLGTTATAPALVYVGTSLTLGTGGTHPYTYYVTPPTYNGLNFTATNIGISGETVATMIAKVPGNLNPLFANNAGINVAVVWGGDNDMAGGASTGQTYSYLQRLCQHLRDMGWQVIVATMISQTTRNSINMDTQKNTYNALIRAGWPQFADGLADLAADSRLGPDGAYSNTTYFNADGIHLNDTSYPIVAGIVQTALTNLVDAGKAAPAVSTLSPEQTSGFSWTGLSGNNYRLTCQALVPSSNGVKILLQFGEGSMDSVSWETAGYQWAERYDGVSGSSSGSLASTGDNGIAVADNVATTNGGLIIAEVTIGGLAKSIQHGAVVNSFKASGSADTYYHVTGGGTYPSDTSPKSAVRLVASSGTIASGYCRLRQENS